MKAKYKGKLVDIGKPFRLKSGGSKEMGVYSICDGEVKLIKFGSNKMRLNRQFPQRKKSYCARSKPLSEAGDKCSPNYWSRKRWKCKNP